MSSLAVPSAVTSTLQPVNIHPHGHGHKKDLLLDLTADSSRSTAAQVPAGSTPSLFGSLFNSLQQIIGARPALAAANPAVSIANAAASSTAAGSAAAGSAAAGSKINLMA